MLGAAFIAVGANLLVDNGTLIAQALGVPESVIALTFVALGTSLPELVTAITSLVKGPQRPVPGQRRGGEPVQPGAGQRPVHHPVPLSACRRTPPSPGINASLVVDIPLMLLVMLLLTVPALAQGQALPLAGRAAALHLCSLLRRPVCNVSLCAGDPARLHAGAGALGQKTVLRKASSFAGMPFFCPRSRG